MSWIVRNLWLVPALPLLAAGIGSLAKQKNRLLAASLVIGSMACSFVLSVFAFLHVIELRTHGLSTLQVYNVRWFQFGGQWLSAGWILDPLTTLMLIMVTFVGLLIFIYSVSYMAHDENFTRFFCFLALFAGAMLGVIVSNSLLLLFMCWEIVGLTSYLLIGFWYERPSAAAAAKKAFLVTRIGDLPLFLGMMWLYARSGTLLFYNGGEGCLEPGALNRLLSHPAATGMAASTAIALLIFCGAAGKSGQVPLHVWLPDAMEGPTPVSALIHAATMVAAGVFLIARIFPLMSVHTGDLLTASTALQVVAWVGAVTALVGAVSAVAQFDIKRILAYSTISQLGYMMMGLGVGGVSVGMFHLLTHAFFKALLFLGAGSIIHGCHGEQDIRHMGGLSKLMPVTFATYTLGMLALCGFPLFFSGFWSKDEILHAAHTWNVSQAPFYMAAFAALLTAFYMTRQLYYVFGGTLQLSSSSAHRDSHDGSHLSPHESSALITVPLVILAAFAVLLGFAGTPAWPWLQSFLDNREAPFSPAMLTGDGFPALLAISSAIVLSGLALGWWLYGRGSIEIVGSPDPMEQLIPPVFNALSNGLYIDALYAKTILPANSFLVHASAWLDRWIWNGAVQAVSRLALVFAHLDNLIDTRLVNPGFDEGCEGVSRSGHLLSLLQTGRVQNYLKFIGGALILLTALLLWGART